MNNFHIDNYIVLANKMEWRHFSECAVSNMWLIVIFQTACELSYNGKNYFTIPPNSIIVCAPHTLHAFKKNDGDFLNTFMFFSVEKEFFDRFSFPLNQVFTISDGYANLIIRTVDEISYIVNTPFEINKKNDVPKMIEHALNIVNAAYIETTKNNPSDASQLQFFSDIRRKMFENPAEITVKKMIDLSNYSSVYFGIKYKEFFGKTPSQDRKKQLVGLIKNYLRSTNYSLETIAEICGLQSVSYLIRLFKTEEKITPYQYRLKTLRLNLVPENKP